MKKKISILLFVFIMCVCSACGTDGNTDMEAGQQSPEYVLETDAQCFFWTAPITKAPEGYYYWDTIQPNYQKGHLMYYDIETKQGVPLCSRSGCLHNTSSCNAFFNAKGEEETNFERSYVQYYEGSVYIMGIDENMNVSLYKVAADGSSWEKYMPLFKIDAAMESIEGGYVGEWIVPDVVIHRGYVYYVNPNEGIQKLRRMKLGEYTVDVLYEAASSHSDISITKPYGASVFFLYRDFDASEDGSVSELHVCDIATGEEKMLLSGAISNFSVLGDTVYMSTDSGIDSFNVTTLERKTIIDGIDSYDQVTVDAKYLYVCNVIVGDISVYTLDGTLVGKLEDDRDFTRLWYGDSQYFFAEDMLNGVGILAVEELLKGNGKWEMINGSN